MGRGGENLGPPGTLRQREQVIRIMMVIRIIMVIRIRCDSGDKDKDNLVTRIMAVVLMRMKT